MIRTRAHLSILSEGTNLGCCRRLCILHFEGYYTAQMELRAVFVRSCTQNVMNVFEKVEGIGQGKEIPASILHVITSAT